MDQDVKKPRILHAALPFVVEAGIILALTGVAIFILNYLKLIDVGALFTNSPHSQAVVPEQGVGEQDQQIPPTVWGRPINPALPNMQVVVQSGAINYEFQVFEMEGEVAQVITVPGMDPVRKIPFAVRLDVRVGSQSAQVPLLYPEQALNVVQVSDQEDRELTFEDLKPGDEITVKTTLSTYMQYPDNYYGVEITKK